MRAFSYFSRAAELGSPEGLIAAGNMYLKGEGGVARNVTKAAELYEQVGRWLGRQPDNVTRVAGRCLVRARMNE